MFTVILSRGSGGPPQSLKSGEDLLSALQPHAQSDLAGHWSDDRVLIAQALWHNTPESLHQATPEVCPNTGRIIASWVRLDNRSDLCVALGLKETVTLTDPQIILNAHLKWGEDCANRLEGDFSFIIYNPDKKQVFCARDSVGVMPFTYYLDDECFVASTSLPALHDVLGPRLTPSKRWIARYLVSLEEDRTETPYQELSHLPPAHHMTVSLQARRKPTEYFSFDIEAEKASKPEAKRLDDYCTAFDRAVKRRLRSAYPMGAEISGGLDSGGIVAYAVPHLRDTLADFKGFGFAMYEHDAQAMQETAMHLNIPFMYVQTSQQLKLDDNEGYCAPPVLGVAPRFDTQGYYNFMLSSARSVGIRTLLSGYGGDEIVTAIAPRIAWAEAFRARDFAKLYAMSSGSGPRRLVEFARNARRGWRYELDAKRHLRNEAFFPTSLLSVEAAEQYGVLDIYREEQKALAEARTFNQVCLGRTKFRRGLAGRLERTALKANTFGVEFRYPMFDRELMVQVLRTPTVNLFEKGVQRSLHRKAISSHLPSRVFAVQKNQMGSQLAPFHWDLLLKMAPQVPTVSSELEEFIDQEKLKYLEEKLAMSSNEHAKLSFQKKAATVMDYHKLKMLDYWLRVS